jgi:biopolymer transport protein ExbB
MLRARAETVKISGPEGVETRASPWSPGIRSILTHPQCAANKDSALPNSWSQAKVSAFFCPTRRSLLFAIIQAAGWPIYFLLAVSIVAVALIVERFMILRQEKIVPGDLLDRVLAAYERQGVSEEMLEQLAQDSPLGRVLASGLRNYRSSRYVMKDAIEEAGRAVTHELERFLTTLGTIATISPLMGLFGTVVGMIEIFGSQSPSGSNPIELAHGISVALYNTGFGLVIAIPAMIFFRHFRGRVETFVVEMEQQAARLVDVVHGERFEYQPPPGAHP